MTRDSLKLLTPGECSGDEASKGAACARGWRACALHKHRDCVQYSVYGGLTEGHTTPVRHVIMPMWLLQLAKRAPSRWRPGRQLEGQGAQCSTGSLQWITWA